MLVTVDDVKNRIGIPLTDPFEDQAIQDAIDAAYAWLPEVRPDVDWTAPTASQRLGIVWLTARYYQELGRSDSNVDSFEGALPLVGRQANQLLGLGFHYPPAVA